MGDVLAIISKAQFEAAHKAAKAGDVLGFKQYVSTHAALEPLRRGGSLFLVTVRPPEERLWLIGELIDPKHDGKAWNSKPSTLAVRDITALIPQLEFTSGKGLAPKKGALGMSLQTPRALTEKDSALLRGAIEGATEGAGPRAESRGPVTTQTPGASSQRALRDAVTRSPSTPLATGGGGAGIPLEEWRATRAPELEKLIGTLSDHSARAYSPLDPDADDFDAGWNARAAEVTPESLPHLLPGLWSDPRGSIPMRLRKLLDLGPDPRLGVALLKMISDPPVTASSNFSMWTLLFKALPSMVDTRATKQLKARAAKKGGDSQFWPKLTGWIEGVLEQLPEPATLPADQLASVAKRQKQAEALLSGPAPAAAKAEKPVAALPMQGSPRETLERAVAGFPLAALEPLRRYWEQTREPVAAELLARIGKLAATDQPRFDEGKPAALHAAWMKAGKRFDATQVTPLLDALIAGTLADAEERLELMLTWPPDPRVAEAMMGLVLNSRIGARPQLWKRTYDLLVRNADPRFRAQLEKNAQALEDAPGFDRTHAERPHAVRTLAPYLEHSAKGRKPSADEAALLEQLSTLASASSAKRKASKKPDEELGLLRAIVAAPDDDTPKLVYADFLTERGDVRGEFINLSISLARGGKVKSKLEAFEKKHKRAIAGALKSWGRDGLRLGLFDKVDLTYEDERKDSELRELAEDLRWVTVRTLTLPDEGRAVGSAILTRAPLFALEELHDVTGTQLAAASAREFPWALRRIALDDYSLDGRTKPSAFPKLQELELSMWGTSTPAFWDAPLLKAVERITMGSKSAYGEIPLDELIIHAPRFEKLEALEVRTAAVDLDVVKAGDGRVDATVTLMTMPSADDDYFVKIVDRLRRIPTSAVRRFSLREEGETRHGVLPLVKEATKHLPRS